jgi:integrase
MGLYKLCSHRGRARDRCRHAWWGGYRGRRVSLSKWANRELHGKDDAMSVLEQLRGAVRAGTFDPRGLEPPKETAPLTFAEFAQRYKERHVMAKGLALAASIDYRLKPLLECFGDRRLDEIRTADVEDFTAELKKPKPGGNTLGRPLTSASINRTIELLRHMMSWAVGREYLDRTPFRRGTETLIRKLPEDNRRRRRLTEDEEAKLLAVAPALLRSMIITALDTGMRRGEMLALRFADIDLPKLLITLRGPTTKSRKTRLVPIATERLRAALEWLWIDPAGEEKPADVQVFSYETGEPVGNFKKAWVIAVLKAHDVKVEWNKHSAWRDLTPECKAEFRKINLHWHDLRHEYASRLVERGVPLAQVRDLLGHASITTTERYDNQKLENLQAAAARLEAGKIFVPDDPSTDDGATVCQVFVKNDRSAAPSRESDPAYETPPNKLLESGLQGWYRYGDSNPGPVAENHVS